MRAFTHGSTAVEKGEIVQEAKRRYFLASNVFSIINVTRYFSFATRSTRRFLRRFLRRSNCTDKLGGWDETPDVLSDY